MLGSRPCCRARWLRAWQWALIQKIPRILFRLHLKREKEPVQARWLLFHGSPQSGLPEKTAGKYCQDGSMLPFTVFSSFSVGNLKIYRNLTGGSCSYSCQAFGSSYCPPFAPCPFHLPFSLPSALPAGFHGIPFSECIPHQFHIHCFHLSLTFPSPHSPV